MLGGLAAAVVLGIMSITVKVDQVVAGTGINVLFLGLTSYLCTVLYPDGQPSLGGGLSERRDSGPLLSSGSGRIFPTKSVGLPGLLLVPLIWYLLNRTTFGLCLRSVGEQPNAADSLGINVNRMRYIAILLAGILGGLGGAALSLGQVSVFYGKHDIRTRLWPGLR